MFYSVEVIQWMNLITLIIFKFSVIKIIFHLDLKTVDSVLKQRYHLDKILISISRTVPTYYSYLPSTYYKLEVTDLKIMGKTVP